MTGFKTNIDTLRDREVQKLRFFALLRMTKNHCLANFLEFSVWDLEFAF
jgi:hypothetical protein